jgi:hypothetical protein
MGEPSIAYLVYRIPTTSKDASLGSTIHGALPSLASTLPARRQSAHFFVEISCRRALLLPRHTYFLYGKPRLVRMG